MIVKKKDTQFWNWVVIITGMKFTFFFSEAQLFQQTIKMVNHLTMTKQ